MYATHAMRHFSHLVDKASATKFSGEAMTEYFLENLLMMIVTMSDWVVHSSNIDNCIQRIQNLSQPERLLLARNKINQSITQLEMVKLYHSNLIKHSVHWLKSYTSYEPGGLLFEQSGHQRIVRWGESWSKRELRRSESFHCECPPAWYWE